MRSILGAICLAATVTANAAPAPAGQEKLAITTERPGPILKFDWPAVEVGVASYEDGPTGVTVFRFRNKAVGAVDVRGGAPGTFNTDNMRLGYDRPAIDAIVFSGGSAYGLEAAAGVATALKDDGVRNGSVIAGVKGAIIYDFDGHRLSEIYPDKRLGQAALHAAKPGVFPQGAQGAGRMAIQGWFFGCGAHSGQGGAFRQVGDTKLAAFVVVNAFGSITDRDGNLVKCHRGPNWGTLTKTAELLAGVPESRSRAWSPSADGTPSGRNTTISLVVTNRKLGWAALQRLAMQVHTSMARAIQPFSTFDDGDALFAVSTEEIGGDKPAAIDLDTIAGEAMWDAILASVPQEPAFAPPANPPTVAPATLARYAGRYWFGPNTPINIETADGKLWATLGERSAFFDFRKDQRIALVPFSDKEFYVAGRYQTRMRFIEDASGKITGAIANPGDWQQTGAREPN